MAKKTKTQDLLGKSYNYNPKVNKKLQRKITKYHRFNPNLNTKNIYLKRLSRKEWIKANLRRMYFTLGTLVILFYLITTMFSNLIGFGVNEGDLFWDWRFLVVPYLKMPYLFFIYFSMLLAPLFTGALHFRFFERLFKRTNWVEKDHSGTAHFLSNEVYPWTTKPKLMAQYFPRVFFLPSGDWIIRSQKADSKFFNDFLEQATLGFEFKASFAKPIKYYFKELQTPLGSRGESVDYTCANDVVTRLRNLSNGKLDCSVSEFKRQLAAFVRSKKLDPIYYTIGATSANAYVIGSTGSGKTTKINYPTIIANANAVYQPNMFIADPKGELNATLSGYLHAQGYNILTLDLFSLERSMSWNPLQEVFYKFLAKSLVKLFLKQYWQEKIYFATRKVRRSPEQIEAIKEKVILDVKSAFERLQARWNNASFNYRVKMLWEYHIFDYDLTPENSDFFANHQNNFIKLITDFYHKRYDIDNPETTEWIAEPIMDENLGVPFELLTASQWDSIDKCKPSQDHFVFNIENLPPYATAYPELLFEFVSSKEITNFVCSQHTGTNASLECGCERSKDHLKKYYKFDGYVFKTIAAFEIYLSTSLSTQISEQINIIKNIIFPQPQNGNNHWINSAGFLFMGLVYIFGYKLEDNIWAFGIEKFNLASLFSFQNSDHFSAENILAEKMALEKEYGKLGNSWYDLAKRKRFLELSQRQDLNNLYAYFKVAGNSEGASINSSLKGIINDLLTDGIKRLATYDDITFNKIIDDSTPTAIIVGINITDKTYHPFVTLFIAALHQKLSDKAKRNVDKKLKRRFMFLLDEFGNIPAIPNLAKILSTCRSENIGFMLIVQSNAQIDLTYGKDKDTIITNCGLIFYLKTNEYDTARYFSNLIGQTTYAHTETTRNAKGFLEEKVVQNKRELLTPDEVFNLDASYYHDTIVILENHKVLIQLVPWYITYQTKVFKSYLPIGNLNKPFNILKNSLDFNTMLPTVENWEYSFWMGELEAIALWQNSNASKIQQISNADKKAAQQEQELQQTAKHNASIDEQLKDVAVYNVVSFTDDLIKHWDLKFEVPGTTSEHIVRQSLAETTFTKVQLWQQWRTFGFYDFDFSEQTFRTIIKDFLTRWETDDNLNQVELANYRYNYSSEEINDLLLVLAWHLLQNGNIKELIKNEQDLNNTIALETYIQDLRTMLEFIIKYELFKIVSNPDNDNNLLQILNIFSKPGGEQYNSDTINFWVKLIRFVDNHIVIQLEKYLNIEKEPQKLRFYAIENTFALKVLQNTDNQLFITSFNRIYKRILKQYWSKNGDSNALNNVENSVENSNTNNNINTFDNVENSSTIKENEND